jgi:formylglycine-generating enzyme
MILKIPRNALFLVACLGCCTWSAAQSLQITSLTPTGSLTWTQSITNGIATIEWTTNLSAGPWLPAECVFTTDTVCAVQLAGQLRPGFYRVMAADTSDVPAGMFLVPAGTFQMGDPYSEGFANALPVHNVYVSGFYIDEFDFTNDQMRQVLQWAYDQGLIGANSSTVTNNEGQPQQLVGLAENPALDDGYPNTHLVFSNGIFSVLSNHQDFPATGVTWYGAEAICNYRSDMEGLPRCVNFTNWTCDFTQPGYRLPTEAEWEKAARGGLTGNHYPWQSLGGTYEQNINETMANWEGSYTVYYPWPTPVGYYNGTHVWTGGPPPANMVNGYGLYDMAGNVWQWVWDFYQSNWYAQPQATAPDTTGPGGPSTRVIRGGSASYASAVWLTCACRQVVGYDATAVDPLIGFRTVRRPGQF